MANINLRVNGKAHSVDVDPATPLLYVLRNDLDLHGPRFGCGLGQCGACTVIIKGEAVRSCIRPISTVQGAEITTLEGLSKDGKLHPLQQAWIDEQVPACGFCQNGQIMTAKALLDKNPGADRRADSTGHGQHAVPLHDLLPHQRGHQARIEDDRIGQQRIRQRGDRMTTSRRDFIKTSGFLVVGFSVAGDLSLAQGLGAGPYPDVDFRQLDSWIVIRQDNTATFFVGKTDLGQGTGTAFRQIMADELDMPYDKTACVMGNTDVTVDQGGSGGSDALQTDGYPMRRVAAEARRVLLEMASARLGVPVAQLVVSDSVVSVAADPSKKVTYGELIGGKRFNVTLTGNNINATTGVAKLKDVQQFKIVGTSPQRYDIPAKVDGSLKWAVDAKVPGMVHARNVKPAFAGAKLVSIDESSVKDVPGLIRVVSKGNYVAVVCEREEQAIQAARQLKVTWQKPASAPFPESEDLFTFMRCGGDDFEYAADRRRQPGCVDERRGEGHRSRL